MDNKVQRTWSLDETTILSLKALAAIFQKTDSQVLENILTISCFRIYRIYEHGGFLMLPSNTNEIIKLSGQKARKTVALSHEAYDQLKKITELARQKESGIVEALTTLKINHIFSLYDNFNELIHTVLSLKTIDPTTIEEGRLIALHEIYTGQIAPSELKRITENLSVLHQIRDTNMI